MTKNREETEESGERYRKMAMKWRLEKTVGRKGKG